MNAFGIDHQRTLTVINLAEGRGPGRRVRSVGDGSRNVIPNALAAGELWGSSAVESAGAACISGWDTREEGIWVEQPGAPVFWQRVYRRLYSYLGRMSPTARNGYGVVIALQAEEMAPNAGLVEGWCKAAGLADLTIIPATQALLCGWLAEQQPARTGERLVCCVSVGDTSVQVCSYQLLSSNGGYPKVGAASARQQIGGTGLAWWIARLIDLVQGRLSEPAPPGCELALRDAAIEYGHCLARAPRHKQVPWTGMLEESMYATLELSAAECELWPEVMKLTAALPSAIRRSAGALKPGASPDVVIVGGVGAGWPFARDVASAVGQVWQSRDPVASVALGSALWPEVGGPGDIDALALPAKGKTLDEAARRESGHEIVGEPSADDSEVLAPPWERNRLDV